VGDQVDIDIWGGGVAASHNMLFPVTDLCFCAIVGNPHLSVTRALSHFANVRLFFSWLFSAGTFSIESSWADQGPRVLIGFVATPTAAVMRVDNKDLVLSALNLTSLVVCVWNHLSIFNQAEETRMALMGNPELTITTALAKGVVCITASNWTGRGIRVRVAGRVVGGVPSRVVCRVVCRVIGRVVGRVSVRVIGRVVGRVGVRVGGRVGVGNFSMQGCNTCKDEDGNKKANL